MNTADKNIKIMVSEVARTLNWHVGDTYSVVKTHYEAITEDELTEYLGILR